MNASTKNLPHISPENEVESGLNVRRWRRDFPILEREVHGRRLVYLDNAATTLKPRVVIEAVERYYRRETANVHRGVHFLSQQATDAYEATREAVRAFLNAPRTREIIFTRGTTEAINLVAQTHGRAFLKAGDEILISHMEHHSNIVPWQLLGEEKGCRLKVAPINDAGELIFAEFERLLTSRTKLVAMVHVSNSLGTINPVKRVIDAAHAVGAKVLIDGAQSVAHQKVDVQELDCDFFAFSSHKLFGPTGVGVLYGKEELLEAMPPWQGGGDMICSVTFEKTTYAGLPAKFEAGTPHIAGVIGLGAALGYVENIGRDKIQAYEREFLAYGTKLLGELPGIRLIGTAREKAAVLAFVSDTVHPHDMGTLVDREGVAIRTGHHCTQPVMARFGVPATSRASLAFYNTREELDAFVAAVAKAQELFA